MHTVPAIHSERHAGRTALVTGASSGIGPATVLRLAREGANVVGCDIYQQGLDNTAAALATEGVGGRLMITDITDQADVDRLVDIAASNGPIDIVANVAGIMDHFLPVGEVDDATWNQVMAVNLTGPMMLCRRVVPEMAQRATGAIVNVAFTAALGHISAGVAYTTSKHAVVGLTRSIAYLYGPRGVRCNAVCPGGVATGIGSAADFRAPWVADIVAKSLARMGEPAHPDEIASLISWLASDEASNINGSIVTADGGFTSG